MGNEEIRSIFTEWMKPLHGLGDDTSDPRRNAYRGQSAGTMMHTPKSDCRAFIFIRTD